MTLHELRMSNAQEQTEQILDLIVDNDLRTNLEIIANLLIQIGAGYMDLPEVSENFIEDVLEDRKKNGETIANATALQGLTLLNWLSGDVS